MLNTCTTITKEQRMPTPVKQVKDVSHSDVFDGKPADGIYFAIEQKPEESEKVVYQFLKYITPPVVEHSDDLDMDRWLVVLFEPIEENETTKVVYYSCYLGDSLAFVKNQVKAGSNGMIVRMSVPGFQILLELVKNLNIDTVTTQIADDLLGFRVNYDIWD